MGSRRHEHLGMDAPLTRKDEQISNLDAHLHQTITHLSLVRARLLSTLDQLEALQQEHTAAVAAAARDQRVLEARLRAAEEMARQGEADRMDMREAVGMLVKKVEATPDFRNWPRSQIHLSSFAEPSLLSSPHLPHSSPSKSRRKQHPTTLPEGPPIPDNHHNHHNHQHNHAALTEQLAYASTLISHFRSERDEAVVRAEWSEARVLELEAKVARRDAEVEACACVDVTTTRAAKMTRSSALGETPSWNEGRFLPGHTASPSRRKPHNDPLQADPDKITDIVDVSVERNMELEREVKQLSRRLDHARAARDARGGPQGATAYHPHQYEGELEHEQHVPDASHVHMQHVILRDRGATPPLQQPYEGDASLLSSLSFSPSSSTSSPGTSGAAGTVTPRQYGPHQDEYRHRPYLNNEAVYEYDNLDERSFSTYEDADEDEDESVTHPVDEVKAARLPTANTDIQFKYNSSVVSDDTAIIKPVAIPIPALRALECQVALLGEKIDAFAAERRRVAKGVVDAGGLRTMGLGADGRAKVDLDLDVVEGIRANGDQESLDVAGVMGGRRKDIGVSDGRSRHTRVEQRNDGSYFGGAGALQGSAQEFKTPQPRPEDTGYDHPHGTCEATLLAARKREMELMARVRVLEGALSVVEAQVRRRVETDKWEGNESGDNVVEEGEVSGGSVVVAQAAVAQKSDTQACWMDAAVQTLKTPPRSPLITPAPVGDLLGTDVPELHVVEEEGRKITEGEQEGTSEREDEEDGTDEGEMPMELATPLLPVHSIPAPDTDDENELEGPRNGHEQASYKPVSETGSSVEEDLGAGSEWDPPDAPADDIESQIPRSAISVLDDGQQRCPANEVELRGNPVPPDHPESPTACLGTAPPPLSTGTSPTIAVGLLPPLPPHAHLSLPLPLPLLRHSHHASSFSSPLLPLPNPHSGLRRAHTDSDIGMDPQQAESTQRFVLYRATSSFVAELRQVESRLAEAAVQDEDRRTLERVESLVAPVAPDTEIEAE